MATTGTDTALEEALAERTRLWEQLHEQRALEREVEDLRSKVARMEGSVSWRVTKPLRLAKLYWDRARGSSG